MAACGQRVISRGGKRSAFGPLHQQRAYMLGRRAWSFARHLLPRDGGRVWSWIQNCSGSIAQAIQQRVAHCVLSLRGLVWVELRGSYCAPAHRSRVSESRQQTENWLELQKRGLGTGFDGKENFCYFASVGMDEVVEVVDVHVGPFFFRDRITATAESRGVVCRQIAWAFLRRSNRQGIAQGRRDH